MTSPLTHFTGDVNRVFMGPDPEATLQPLELLAAVPLTD